MGKIVGLFFFIFFQNLKDLANADLVGHYKEEEDKDQQKLAEAACVGSKGGVLNPKEQRWVGK